MKKGLDVGYRATKDNEGRIFLSAYSYYDKTILGSKCLTIDGKDYYVGRGMQNSDMNKTNSEMNKVCTFYNLCLSGGGVFQLCVGLPVAQYQKQKQALKESILEYNHCKIEYNRVPISFMIKDVYVVMQGVASLYVDPSLIGDFIVIDIGGWTVDTSLVRLGSTESSLETHDTWYKGIRTLHSSVIEKVNNEFELTLEPDYAEEILKNGYAIVDGKKEPVDFLKPFLQTYVNEMIDEIKLKYPWRSTNIVLVGGGALLMYGAFRKHFPNCLVMPDPQFSNAKGYYAIACSKFQ